MERKKALKDLDLVRNENTKLNDLEQEQKKSAEALLEVKKIYPRFFCEVKIQTFGLAFVALCK